MISIQQHARNITGWPPGSKHGIQIEKSSSQRKNFHIRELKEKNKFLVYLAILKLSRNFLHHWRTFYPYFLDIYIKLGIKGPLVERSGCWVDLYNYLLEKWIHMKESSIIMFLVLSAVKERLQYLILALIDQVTADVLFRITCFSSLLFLNPQRITSIKYIPQTSVDLMHRLIVVRLLLAIF